ncbi:MAG: DNA-directed RNA polymerase subunit beta, partial [Candidatus Paceibacteria bacterium]
MQHTQNARTFLSPKVDMELPNLIEPQLRSYHWFLEEGLKQLFEEHYPINDWTESEYKLEYLGYRIDEPKTTEATARSKNLSYEAPLRVKVKLTNYETGSDKTQEVFFGDVPVMTERGTFIINGTERVVISQIIRSPGVFFMESLIRETTLFGAKLIPNRGAWLEMDTDAQGVIWVKIDRKRKVPVTTLLRILGWSTNEQILKEFEEDSGSISYIKEALKKDPSTDEG